MASFNKVILIGNLTRDPELRTTATGLSVCKFSIAVNKVSGSGDDKKEQVSFFEVTAFNKQAEVIARFLVKGRPILIDGELQQDRWETPEGEKRNKIGVILNSFQFLGSGGDDSQKQERPASKPQYETTQYTPDRSDIEDDDVPF